MPTYALFDKDALRIECLQPFEKRYGFGRSEADDHAAPVRADHEPGLQAGFLGDGAQGDRQLIAVRRARRQTAGSAARRSEAGGCE